MSFEYFGAESHVSTYNKFRPSPPPSLIEKIVEFTTEKIPKPLELALDVGCGSGQSTEVLAPYFKKIIGLDSSDQIIKEARIKCQHANIFYSTNPAEKINVEDESAQLITVGQALHWLDIPKFYSEAKRILKPQGVLAVYGYHLPIAINENEKITIIEKYYKDILREYTLPQSQKVYLDNYMSEEFNIVDFVEGGKMKRFDNFMLDTEGDVNDVVGYITSWSAFQNYVLKMGEEKGRKLLKDFKNEFLNLAKCSEKKKFQIRFNYFLLLGRKQ